MNSSVFFDISAGAYIAAMITYVIYLVVRNNTVSLIASGITIFGFVSQTAALAIRWSIHMTSGCHLIHVRIY